MDPKNGIREVRSFLMPRDPSIDRRYRPRPDRQVNLYKLIAEEDEEEECSVISDDEDARSVASSSCSSSTNSSSSEGALVYLRFKPVSTSKHYKISGNVLITTAQETAANANNKSNLEKHFTFTDVFDGSVSQPHVFDTCLRSKIEADENFTVLTYGTSGSGKTFTLLGDLENPGVIPRALEFVFTLYANNIYPQPAAKIVNANVIILDDDSQRKEQAVRATLLGNMTDIQAVHRRVQHKIHENHSFETKTQDQSMSIFIYVSFVEIYNENVYDLLSATIATNTLKRKTLKIVSNDGKVFIKDLTSVYVKSAAEAYKLLTFGLQKVKYASTAINAHSSRSHCIFFVDVIKYTAPGLLTSTSYRFCDLAGSERLGKTGNVGSRLKEAQRINTSLMVLGRCLDAANNNQKKRNADVIPFRESKLTMLLQSALLGKEKLSMIVTITPTEQYFEENMSVLGFASIAKNIVFKPQHAQKESICARYSWFSSQAGIASSTSAGPNPEFEALFEENISLRSEIERLSCENSRLEGQLIQQEVDLRNQLIDDFQKTSKDRNKKWEERLAAEMLSTRQLYDSRIAAMRDRHLQEIEDMEEEFAKTRLELEMEIETLRKQIKHDENDENKLKKRRVTLGDLNDTNEN